MNMQESVPCVSLLPFYIDFGLWASLSAWLFVKMLTSRFFEQRSAAEDGDPQGGAKFCNAQNRSSVRRSWACWGLYADF
jgi:hypothetical protein